MDQGTPEQVERLRMYKFILPVEEPLNERQMALWLMRVARLAGGYALHEPGVGGWVDDMGIYHKDPIAHAEVGCISLEQATQIAQFSARHFNQAQILVVDPDGELHFIANPDLAALPADSPLPAATDEGLTEADTTDVVG